MNWSPAYLVASITYYFSLSPGTIVHLYSVTFYSSSATVNIIYCTYVKERAELKAI